MLFHQGFVKEGFYVLLSLLYATCEIVATPLQLDICQTSVIYQIGLNKFKLSNRKAYKSLRSNPSN